MKVNCFEVVFEEDNLLPFIREGIQVLMKNNYFDLNGLGRYRVFRCPEEIEDNDIIEEKFSDYLGSDPWLGQESDKKMYLYRMQINENNLNLEKVTSEYKYLYITTKYDDDITVLNGKIFFRNFYDNNQMALIRFDEGTILRIDKEEGLIMIELVDGEFICR
jgi:hypothetical protein